MSDRVPFFDLTRSGDPIQEEIIAALRSVVLSGQFVLGPEIQTFERTLADYSQARHAVALPRLRVYCTARIRLFK